MEEHVVKVHEITIQTINDLRKHTLATFTPGQVLHFREVNLAGCKLLSLRNSDSFQLCSTEIIDLSENNLQTLDYLATTFGAPALQILIVKHNILRGLWTLSPLPSFASLTTLDLSNNRLNSSAIENLVPVCPNLLELNLNNNILTIFPQVQGLSRLAILELAGNLISQVQLAERSTIQQQNPSPHDHHHLLSPLPPSIEVLDIRSNDLLYISDFLLFVGTPRLREILAVGNPVVTDMLGLGIPYRSLFLSIFGGTNKLQKLDDESFEATENSLDQKDIIRLAQSLFHEKLDPTAPLDIRDILKLASPDRFHKTLFAYLQEATRVVISRNKVKDNEMTTKVSVGEMTTTQGFGTQELEGQPFPRITANIAALAVTILQAHVRGFLARRKIDALRATQMNNAATALIGKEGYNDDKRSENVALGAENVMDIENLIISLWSQLVKNDEKGKM
eukprot:g3373.t1